MLHKLFLDLYHYIQLTRAIDIINNSTGGKRVSAANATRGGESTKRVFLIQRAGVSPANGSPTPLHPSTVIDEHSVGVKTISDQNSLEGTGNGLCNVWNDVRERLHSHPQTSVYRT